MRKSFIVTFPSGLTAFVAQVESEAELPAAVGEMGLHAPRPILVLVGGADGLHQPDLHRLRPLFAGTLAPLAQDLGVSIVDGGTDAGVMRLMGQARAESKGDFPLIGVAAVGTITLPGASPTPSGATSLEPNHSHFLLVPGSRWGDESPWLTRTAGVLADSAPSVTVLVDGGETAWQDVTESVRARRPVVAVAGSGRVADILAAALAGEAAGERERELAASGLIHAVKLSESSDTLTKLIGEILSTR